MSEDTNHLMIQYFEWHLPADGKHWNKLANSVQELKELGITAVWIPPPTKGSGPEDVGYGVYDLWDLGEFEQKGTLRTKYGTKEELVKAIKELNKEQIVVYADAVMNHKLGADQTELFQVEKVSEEDRTQIISEPFDIEGWTKFDFEGRNEKYSKMKWHFYHFTATDFDNKTGENGIFKIIGENKNWAKRVDKEKGNFDYLMGADIDHQHGEVVEDLINWGKWIQKELNLDGFRLDALKHIDSQFIKKFLKAIREQHGKLFAVGEYWNDSLDEVNHYIDSLEGQVNLFDVPLHFNLMECSKDGKGYDLSKIFNDTLVNCNPINAVTFVDNHDSQPGESLESWVEDWFKPHAYALILLRKDGYPCVFYGDLYGLEGPHPIPSKYDTISKLCKIRKNYAYGQQDDYFDHHDTIGWVRHGNDQHPKGLAVVLCSSDEGNKKMFVGKERKGQKWKDLLGFRQDEVTIDEEGFGEFWANGGSISVYSLIDECI